MSDEQIGQIADKITELDERRLGPSQAGVMVRRDTREWTIQGVRDTTQALSELGFALIPADLTAALIAEIQAWRRGQTLTYALGQDPLRRLLQLMGRL
jgi:hypothetical protein